MKIKSTFARYELKYLITKQQKKELLNQFPHHLTEDEFGRSSIFNIYYDTKDFLLIRRSLEKPVYKEKLRLRSYGKADENTKVFLELKKKYQDVVYKRRVSLREANATDYFRDCYQLPHTQIGKEIDYFKTMYQTIAPQVFIAYDREAFFDQTDEDFRITFDENLRWRDYDVSLCSEAYGDKIIPDENTLMEIKVARGIPLWLTHFLTQNKIYKTSFSKYGIAYSQMLKRGKEIKDAA